MTQFAQTVSEETVVVHVSGEVDLSVTESLVDAVRPHLREGRTVELDLSGLAFIDSSGMGVLVQLLKEAAHHGARLVLTRVPARARRLLEVSGLLHVFDVRSGEETPGDGPS